MRPFFVASRIATGVLLVLVGGSSDASAQTLALKRTLSVGVAPGCPVLSGTQPARRDNAEARRLAATGQEAALIGDRTGARDAFAKAVALNPSDERIVYDLARAHEELGESEPAIREYCRYLSLAPGGSQADDVRARLTRLAPRNTMQAAERALERFRVGIASYDRARFDAAVGAFDDVVRAIPGASEALFNRALANAASSRRDNAMRDLEAYLAANPTANDRFAVAQAIESLRRPTFSPGEALRLGIIPGFGQFYTRRPAFGALVVAGVAATTAAALYERTEVRTIPYVDPNGVPAPYNEEFTERPFMVPAIASAAVFTVGAAIEAFIYARASHRGIADAPRGLSTGLSIGDRPIGVAPQLRRDGIGLSFSGRF